jgi:hypothetical protein
MNIHENAYLDLLYNCPPVPPEAGGILGGKDDVITTVIFDVSNAPDYGGYTPNVANLNAVIASWADNNIDFMGIFHSHCPSGISLSRNDRIYIEKIMVSMPHTIYRLYFPIVIPGGKVIPYVASCNSKEQAKEVVLIEKDKLVLVGNKIMKGGERREKRIAKQ